MAPNMLSSIVVLAFLLHFVAAAQEPWKEPPVDEAWKHRVIDAFEHLIARNAALKTALIASVATLAAVIALTAAAAAAYLFRRHRHQRKAKAASQVDPEKEETPSPPNRAVTRRQGAPMEPITELRSPARSTDRLPPTFPPPGVNEGSTPPALPKRSKAERTSMSQPIPPTTRPPSPTPLDATARA